MASYDSESDFDLHLSCEFEVSDDNDSNTDNSDHNSDSIEDSDYDEQETRVMAMKTRVIKCQW